MKTTFITAILFLATGFAGLAQDETYRDEPQTIFSTGSKVTGWFVEFSGSYTRLNGEYAYMPGLAGGIVMNRNLSIGLIGKSLSWYPACPKYDNILDEPVYLEGGYGGLYLVASPIDKKVLHITFPLVIGAGGAAYVSQEQYPEIDDFEDMDDLYDYDHCTLSSSPYFIVEPGANVELTVTGFMKLYAGYSYRLMMGLNLENTSSTALNGSSFNFGVKFGKF